MNISLALRYMAELAMVLPAAAFAIIPVFEYRKVKLPFFIGALFILLTAFFLIGTELCIAFDITSNTVIFPSMIIFFIFYHLCFELSISKKIFCFANATFLCAFSTTYNTFLTAPLELENTYRVYELCSGVICLVVSAVVGAVFVRTLLEKFPELFENENLDSVWKILMAGPIIAALALIWMNPVSAANVMTGRLRMICLVVLLSIPLMALFLYHILWCISKNLTETAQLQQSLDLLKMEEKQYRKTMEYLQESANQRHDFRQHILIINNYLENGQTDKLKEYLSPIIATVSESHRMICENQVVNAIANHYNDIAKARNVTINWSIDLGNDLPTKESDMCAVLGNLVENAIKAAAELDGDNRLVDIRIWLLNPKTLVISIFNAYRGSLKLDKHGLPISDKDGHGIGLRSVKNIVKRYKGTMEIETLNGIFNVSILMYEPD